MTDQADGPGNPPTQTAGALLRAARQAQGLHIAALATTLKVAPRKLEALEADRYDEFQGATFVRALALAACRALKVDPSEVLERLPAQDSGLLSQLDGGLNAPFRERGVRREVPELPGVGNAVWALGLLLVLGALGFWLLPKGWHWPGIGQPASAVSAASDATSTATPAWPPAAEASAPMLTEPAAPAPSSAAPVPAPVPASVLAMPSALPPVASAAPSVTPPAAPVVAPVAVGGSAPVLPGATVVQLHARAPSWVEVVDARSKVLIGRTLVAGETVGLDGVLPLRVKIGNAKATELSFRGRTVDLEAAARDNVARLELK